MIKLTSNTVIGKYQFKGLTDCEISSSWDQLTDTCTLTFPRRVEWQNKVIAFGEDPVIKKGDKVTVDLGYDGRNERSFTGYVNTIEAGTPVKVMCEDAMWLLKQKVITKSYKDVDLKTLLQDVLSGVIQFEAPDVRLGPFRISKATVAEVLKHLREKYFLKSFIRGKLYCGLAYWPSLQNEVTVKYNLHVVEDNLTYVRSEDVKVQLKIINISTDNVKTEYEFGDPDGDVRTLHYYDKNAAEINHIGKEEIQRMKYTGYRGSLTIFGQPFTQHGDAINIIDDRYPERDGRYLVKSVDTRFGQNGYRQKIELENKI